MSGSSHVRRLRPLAMLSLTATLLCLTATIARAQLTSRIESVLPRVGQRGTSLDVVVRGINLADPREIVFYRPGIRCTAIGPVTEILSDAGKPVIYGLAHGGKIAEEVRCRFEIAADCPLGEHAFHIRNDEVLTMLSTFNVTPFPCVDEYETRLNSNDTLAKAVEISATVTVRGNIRQQNFQDVDFYKVPVQASKHLAVEANMAQIAEAHTGASEVDLAIRILDESGRELAANDDNGLHVQDPVASILPLSDGFVYVEVKQSTFTAITPSAFGLGGMPYTLHVGIFRRPLAAYPAGGPVGEPLKVKLLGDPPRDYTQTIDVPTAPGWFEYFGDAPSPLMLRACSFPNVLEDEKGATTVVEALPAALNGVIAEPGDADVFRLAVNKGSRWRVRVFASSLGAMLDPIVRLRPLKPDGKPGDTELEVDDATLAERDIFGHYPRSGGGLKDVLDPSFIWTPKRDGQYELEITDTAGSGSSMGVYRVDIEPASDGVAFTTFVQGQYVSRGGSRGFQFRVEPLQGNTYSGPIQVVAHGLPEGVKFSCPPIPAGTALPLLTWPGVLECSSSVTPCSGFFSLEARPVASTTQPLRTAFQWRAPFIIQVGGDAFHIVRLEKMALAVTEPAPFELELATPSTALVCNGELAVPVKIRRREDFTLPITLDILWLPFGVGKAAAPTMKDGETEAILRMSAAANAKLGMWPLTVLASVDLGPKRGVMFASTPIVNLTVARPFVELATPLESLRRGERKRYVWSVTSKPTFDGSATVKLLGLPKGVSQIGELPRITKETQQVAFEIEATDEALLGPVGGVACEVVLQAGGQEIHQRSGNATLRIDPKL